MCGVRQIFPVALAAITIAFAAVPSGAAVLNLKTYDFEGGAQGWFQGDPSEAMGFAHNGTNLVGTFGADSEPYDPTTGAFSSSAVGDDLTDSGFYTWTQFRFDFYAINVVPASITLSFGFESYYIYQTISGVGLLGNGALNTIVFSLANLNNWDGATASFAAISSSPLTVFDVGVERAYVDDAQTFWMDNFSILGDLSPEPPTPSAIPEPGVVNMILFAAILLMVMRRRFIQRPLPVEV